jgi:hypothetical protein
MSIKRSQREQSDEKLGKLLDLTAIGEKIARKCLNQVG